MKIRVNESPKIEEIEVVINCRTKNEHVRDIERSITYLNKVIIGKLNDRSYTLKPNRIYYFDTVENKVFAYTKDRVYEVNMKLYQLEEILENTPLIRISKNTILNIRKIRTFKAAINGRMEAELLNGEMIIISRKYVPVIKQILGGEKQ